MWLVGGCGKGVVRENGGEDEESGGRGEEKPVDMKKLHTKTVSKSSKERNIILA